MKAYIENIAGFMVLVAFLNMAAGEKFRQSAGFITGLMLLAALCAPLKDIIPENIPEINFKTADTAQYDTMREKIILNGIKTTLENQIKKETGFEAYAKLDENNAVSEVKLYGADENARQKTAQLCGIDAGRVIIEDIGSKK